MHESVGGAKPAVLKVGVDLLQRGWCFILFTSQFSTFKSESFAGAGVNKSFYWTNKVVFSSETYIMISYF